LTPKSGRRYSAVSADGQGFFSPDYFTARDRFRDAARRAGATLDALTLEARGPRQEVLTIDIARLGDREARRVLVHTCGLHGVEAFAGSAVQLAILATPPPVPSDCELVLIHVLNPYGMAWLRRVNENNVDLNRNFLGADERRERTSVLYRLLDPLLNPPSPPGTDAFVLRLAAFALRHGLTATRQAIAEGQFDFPRGLFFGGTSLEPGPRAYLDWLGRHFGKAERVFALDVHTGLGRRGESTLILEEGVGSAPAAELERALGSPIVDPAAGEAVFRIRGGMGHALPQALPRARVDFLLQEIGTYPTLAVLRALREENRCHHHLDRANLRHSAKLGLLEALRPDAPGWRKRAVMHGMSLAHAAARWIFREAGESG
jgi:hypothetical protein